MSEPAERLFADPNFSVLLRGCTQALAKHDIGLFLCVASSDDERSRVTRFVAAGHVDGALLVSTHAEDPLPDMLSKAGGPQVACGVPLGHESSVAYVAADDRGGARAMVQYLCDLGRSRIATVTGPLDLPGGQSRLDGYRDVLGPSYDPALVAEGNYTQESGEAAMSALLDRAPELDAVFVASDVMARRALVARHQRVPPRPADAPVSSFPDAIGEQTMTPVPWFRHHGITSLAASRCSRLFSGCSESGYARGMLVGRLLPHGSGAHGSSGGDAIRLLPAVPVSPPWAGGTSLPALRRAVRYGDGRT